MNKLFLPKLIALLCNPADFGCLAGMAAGGAFTAIVESIGKGVIVMVKFLSTFWIGVPSPELASGSGSSWALNAKIAEVQGWLGPVTATIAVCSFAVAMGRMAWDGDFRQAHGAGRQVAMVAAGSLVVAAITQVLIAAGDAWSPWVIAQASGGDASTGLQTLIVSGMNGGKAGGVAGLWLILFVLCALGALVQCVFMCVRGPVLWVLMAFVPATAAGSASEEGWARFKRMCMVMLAFTLYKPVAATIYASGLLLMTKSGSGSADNVQAAVYGLSIMVLAALALPALIKFLVPLAAVGSSSAFSGGAAVGAIAGGAAILATVGAGGAGAAAGAAGAGGGPGGSGPGGPSIEGSTGGGGGSRPGGSGPVDSSPSDGGPSGAPAEGSDSGPSGAPAEGSDGGPSGAPADGTGGGSGGNGGSGGQGSPDGSSPAPQVVNSSGSESGSRGAKVATVAGHVSEQVGRVQQSELVEPEGTA